jgi:hypothetical protein
MTIFFRLSLFCRRIAVVYLLMFFHDFVPSLAEDLHLPDPLRFANGMLVNTPMEWEMRREEIIALYETSVYGPRVKTAASATFELRSEKTDSLGGLAVRREIRVYFLGDKNGPWMDLLVYVPKKNIGKVPAFFGFNYMGNQSVTNEDDVAITSAWIRHVPNVPGIVDNHATEENRGAQARRWPLELILQRGYAVATACFGEVEPDEPLGWTRSPLRQSLGLRTTGVRGSEDVGAIGIWAFAAGRALDCLATIPEIDATRVALTGHSRMGKTALWAAALDRRFALVVSNDSGEGGASLARRKMGERIADSVKSSGYWYSTRYSEYVNREETLPVDAHFLMALIAPRPLYVSSATEDLGADPEGEFLATWHVGGVYALYGFRGLDVPTIPTPDTSVGDRVGYHVRKGIHDILEGDWQFHLDFADRFLKSQ